MTGLAGLAALALLATVELGRACDGEGRTLICREIPSRFGPGYLTLILYLTDAGRINSSALRSDALASVTRLRVDGAGVTDVDSGAFGSLRNLSFLSLNRNALTWINSGWFDRPAVLRQLSLAENRIEAVDESSLSGLVNLTVLRLNKNHISTVGPGSFRSLTSLVELDLSENQLTRVSPEVFPLGSIKIRLDGNPWDCSCEARDSVDFLREQVRLNGSVNVTCRTPEAAQGQAVLSVSVCPTDGPGPGPGLGITGSSGSPVPSETSVRPEPTDAGPFSTAQPSEADTSVGPEPTVRPEPTVGPEPTVRPEPTDGPGPSVRPEPTDGPGPSVRPEPTDVAATVPSNTETCGASEPSATTDAAWTLVAAIVVLCLLLFLACFLAALHRRKRHDETVTPEERTKSSGPGRSPGRPEKIDPEVTWTRPFAGVRAKSANAVLSRSSGKDRVASQNETEAETRTEGQQNPVNETEAEPERRSNRTAKQADGDPGENPQCVSDTVPYLSIGAKPDPNKRCNDSPGQRSVVGKAVGRISTWPPTAAQWQARCQVQEQQLDAFTAWRRDLGSVSGEAEPPSGPDQAPRDQALPTADDPSPAPTRPDVMLEEEETIRDPATGRRAVGETQNPDFRPARKAAARSRNKAEQRDEPRGAETSKASGGSRAPSGGASPGHHNPLLSMDLLHEVVQNNGRWTRERWRQIHVKQRR